MKSMIYKQQRANFEGLDRNAGISDMRSIFDDVSAIS